MRKRSLARVIVMSAVLSLRFGSGLASIEVAGPMQHMRTEQAVSVDTAGIEATADSMKGRCCDGDGSSGKSHKPCKSCFACSGTVVLHVGAASPGAVPAMSPVITDLGRTQLPARHPPGVWRPPCIHS